ncbi:hypothetical protein [Elstera litoralis]|uniref:hypothetical protein n=1 Tax=Elstera litoralis TaxID=552518 RepID=UPI0018DCF3EA|nr:hypothetical protein [Elstera litoralis]
MAGAVGAMVSTSNAASATSATVGSSGSGAATSALTMARNRLSTSSSRSGLSITSRAILTG